MAALNCSNFSIKNIWALFSLTSSTLAGESSDLADGEEDALELDWAEEMEEEADCWWRAIGINTGGKGE